MSSFLAFYNFEVNVSILATYVHCSACHVNQLTGITPGSDTVSLPFQSRAFRKGAVGGDPIVLYSNLTRFNGTLSQRGLSLGNFNLREGAWRLVDQGGTLTAVQSPHVCIAARRALIQSGTGRVF